MKSIIQGIFGIGLAIFFASAIVLTAESAQAATIQLPKGTEIRLTFVEGMNISSADLAKDIPILAFLADSIEIGGKIVVEKGAQATAKVVEVEQAKKGGKAGSIKIEFIELDPKGAYQTLDGSKIKIIGGAENSGKKKSFFWKILFGIGFFMKGGEGVIPTDSVYTAQVAESIILESK